MKIEFYLRIFEKYSVIESNKNPPSGSRVPCEQTYIHDEAKSRFSQFFERA